MYQEKVQNLDQLQNPVQDPVQDLVQDRKPENSANGVMRHVETLVLQHVKTETRQTVPGNDWRVATQAAMKVDPNPNTILNLTSHMMSKNFYSNFNRSCLGLRAQQVRPR